ncbi:MAG: DUF364 domain-containing protein [Pseudomonadota bacterium]
MAHVDESRRYAHGSPERKSSSKGSTMTNVITVDISDPDRKRAFEDALHVLEDAGWSRGVGKAQFEVGEAQANRGTQPSNLLLACRDRAEAQLCGAIQPEPFELVKALGAAEIERSLADSIGDAPPVDKVIIGFNWTMVRAGALCGIARSPARGTEGARTIRPEHGFRGSSLKILAQNLMSMDPLCRALGLAAVNAYWNRPEPPAQVVPFVAPRGGLATIKAPGEGAIIVGGFRGALERLPKARIVEREPKPGDISVAEAPAAFAKARILAVTAQTLMNASLAPIIAATAMVPYRILFGPSCPACPVLFDHGVDEVFGAVIRDPDAAEAFILESGTMIMLDHIATTRTLRAAHAFDNTGV